MKPIIKVVRIEHPSDGLGFWNSCNQEICEKHSEILHISLKHADDSKFPNYNNDEKLKSQIPYEEMEPYKFSFKTLDQLKEAFTPSQIKECINKLGFRILLLSVNDYFESPFQVVFKDPIESEDISSLFV